MDEQRNKGDRLEKLTTPNKYKEYSILPLRVYFSPPTFDIIKNTEENKHKQAYRSYNLHREREDNERQLKIRK